MATIYDSHLLRALRVTPNASQTRSKAPGQVGPAFGPGDATDFPLFAVRGEGPYLWDDRGRKYLDCFGANAAIPLGYAYWPVVEAIVEALSHGSLLSLPHVRELTISERFLELCAPWAHQVRWTKTGSEALHAAVLIARAYTHRAVVLVADSAYHGWHSWFQASHALDLKGQRVHAGLSRGSDYAWCADDTFPNGTPACYGHTIGVYRYGDLESVREVAARAAGTSQRPGSAPQSCVAAVLVEPHRWEPTDRAWLVALRDWCRANGALLIFDELVYGLRWAKGGAAEYFNVEPDLACFGKALGNGVPIACVCGPTHLMTAAGSYVSGTYFGDTIGLAAAGAVLEVYDDRGIEGVIDRLWTNGRRTWEGFAATAPSGAHLEGQAVHWRLAATGDLLDFTLAQAASMGVLIHRSSNNASAAMSQAEARHAGEVLGESLCVATEMVQRSS